MGFEIVIPPGFSKQANDGIMREVNVRIKRRLLARSIKIRKGIGAILVAHFRKTDVCQALRGAGSTDLAAHFGLSDANAKTLAANMEQVIRESPILVDELDATGGGRITVKAIPKDYKDFLDLPNAEYVSVNSFTGTSIPIPVMKWMLLEPYKDAGQAKYEIVFKGGQGVLDAYIARWSRSGRAIMSKLTLGGGTPYMLPDIVRGSLGENFLEYALRQKGVEEAVLARVFKDIS